MLKNIENAPIIKLIGVKHMTNIIYDAMINVDASAVPSSNGNTITIYTQKVEDMLQAMKKIGENAWISARHYISIKR